MSFNSVVLCLFGVRVVFSWCLGYCIYCMYFWFWCLLAYSSVRRLGCVNYGCSVCGLVVFAICCVLIDCVGFIVLCGCWCLVRGYLICVVLGGCGYYLVCCWFVYCLVFLLAVSWGLVV